MSDFLDLAIGHDLIDHGTSDDHYTPPHIFEALGLTFDMDVSAPPGGVPWIPARRSIDVIEDGLATPWEGLVWCNPPYSSQKAWITKFLKHNNGLILLPIYKDDSTRTIWKNASAIALINDDIHFIISGGKRKRIMMPCFLSAMGNVAVKALKASGLGHVR